MKATLKNVREFGEKKINNNRRRNAPFLIHLKMNRREKLECLLEIQEAVEYFERRIDELAWSNDFGAGLEWLHIRKKNTHNIIIDGMCIGRLNERFTKQLNTLK